jgi:hypothetical protein
MAGEIERWDALGAWGGKREVEVRRENGVASRTAGPVNQPF